MDVQVVNLSLTQGGKKILHGITLSVHPRSLTALIGPNGSGKTSLIRCLYRSFTPQTGEILIGGKNIKTIPQKLLAQRIAVVLQEENRYFDRTALEMVLLGRTPYHGFWETLTEKDRQKALQAIHKVGATHLTHRRFDTLSGGEKQLIRIARALAQEPEILVLDEPTNHLDIRYQLEIMELVRRLPMTKIVALHDLNLAAQYCDFVYLLHHGTILASGTPPEVFSSYALQEAFQVNVFIFQDPQNHTMFVHCHLPKTE